MPASDSRGPGSRRTGFALSTVAKVRNSSEGAQAMSHHQFVHELESTADHIANVSRADVQVMLRRAGDHAFAAAADRRRQHGAEGRCQGRGASGDRQGDAAGREGDLDAYRHLVR